MQALVKYSALGAKSIEDYTQSINERVHAMAQTHSLLTANRWEGIDLRKVIAEQSAAFGDRVAVAGPPLLLRPKAALSIALALHELLTNAAKYGALSGEVGRVAIAWAAENGKGERRLILRWREKGGPPVSPPTRMGFGRLLLERSLAYDLDGEVDLDFRPEGLSCTAVFPFDHVMK